MAKNEVIKRAALELYVDGEAKFKKTVNDLNASMRTADASLRQINERMRTYDGSALKAADKAGLFREKTEILNRKLDEQRKKTETLRQRLDEAAEAYGEDSIQAEKLRAQVTNSETAEMRLEKQLQKTTKELSLQESGLYQLSQKAETASKKLKAAGDKISKVGGTLTKYVSAPIAAAGVAALKYASDAEETLQKVGEVFGENASDIEKWSETAIEKMGLASQTAQDAAALYGDMGYGMGVATDKSLEMAMGLTQLSADMASFKNISQERTQLALQGVYTGETEALKSLGVVMTEANLKQYAASKGIKKNIKDMTQAEKVQLRYNYVMEVTAKAHGDFERTGGGVANQSRKLKEQVKQLATQFGKNLLPVAKDVLSWANDLLAGFTKLDPKTQKLIIKIAAITAATGPVVKIFGSLTKVVGGVTGAIGTFTKKIAEKTAAEAASAVATKTMSTAMGNAGTVGAAGFGPAGWVMLGIAALGGLVDIIESIPGPLDEVYESMSGMAQAAADYQAGIDSATSALTGFDESAALSEARQTKLKESVDATQNGITELTRSAVNERRNLTEEEFQRLQELIDQLGVFADAQIEVYNQKSRMLEQMIKNDSEMSQEESQQYLKAVQENADGSIAILEEQRLKQYEIADGMREDAQKLREEGHSALALNMESDATKIERIAEQNHKEEVARVQKEAAELANLVMQKYTAQNKIENDSLSKMAELAKRRAENQKSHDAEMARINKLAEKDGADHTAELLRIAGEYQKREEAIDNEMKALWNDRLTDYAGTLIGMAVEAQEKGETLTAENQSIVEDILGVYDTLPDEMKEDGRQSLISIADGLKEQFPQLADAANMTTEELLYALRSALGISGKDESELYRIGKTAGEDMASGMASRKDAVGNEGENLANEMLDSVAGSGERDINKRFKSLGNQAADSLGEGATKNTNVVAKAYELADTFWNAYKRRQQQASPSKRFIQAGKFDVLGLAKGYDDNAKIAAKSAANMATATFNSARAALAKYSGLQMDTTLPDLSGYVPQHRKANGGQDATGKQVIINQNNNWTTPKHLNAAETARQNRNALKLATLGVSI